VCGLLRRSAQLTQCSVRVWN